MACSQNARGGEDGGTQSPLMMGTGARPMAMGRAAAATTDGAEALFWNPARLGGVQRGDFRLFHTQLSADGLSYQAGFFTYPTLDLGTVALGYQRLGASGLERRDDRNLLTGTFAFSESHLLLGYGRSVHRNLALGATVRIAQQRTDEVSDLGVGLDLGVAWERPVRGGGARWSLGANFQNAVAPELRLEEEGVADPRNLKLGAGYLVSSTDRRISWGLAVDLDLPERADARFGLGGEVGLDQTFFLRGGADGGRLTLGFGVLYRGVRLDYAMRTHDELARSDRITVGLHFGLPVPERLALRQREREQAVNEQLATLLAQREEQAYRTARAEADDAFASGDFENATVLYRRVLLLDPEDAVAAQRVDESERRLRVVQANAVLLRGDAAQAAAAYQAVLDRWPDEAEARAGLEQAHLQLENAQNREAQLNSVFRAALSRFSQGDLVETTGLLDELLRLDPGHELGRELHQRVTALRLSRGQERLAEAEHLATQGQWPAALQRLDAALKLLPERSSELAARRRAWRTAQDEAREQARELAAAQESPTPMKTRPDLTLERRQVLEERFRQGLTAFQSGDLEAATSIWQTIWIEAPAFPAVSDYLVKAYLLEGVQLFGQGDYRVALDRCRRVLDIDPDNDKAKRYVASIEEQQAQVEAIWSEGR